MSAGLVIPEDVLVEALSKAIHNRVSSVDLDELKLITAKQAADMFGITPQSFREIAADAFDLGQRRTRWSLKEIKEILETRRVRKKPASKR